MSPNATESIPAPDLDDRQLLDRYRAGYDDAFTLLYRRHTRSLLFYARAILGDAGRAEDVVQEAFLRLAGVGPDSIRTSLQALLYTIVRNLAIDLSRRAAHPAGGGEALEDAPGGVTSEAPSPSEELSLALERLPRDQRETVILKVNSGFTFQEIADFLGIPLRTAMSRYKYAIEKLGTMCQVKRGDA